MDLYVCVTDSDILSMKTWNKIQCSELSVYTFVPKTEKQTSSWTSLWYCFQYWVKWISSKNQAFPVQTHSVTKREYLENNKHDSTNILHKPWIQSVRVERSQNKFNHSCGNGLSTVVSSRTRTPTDTDTCSHYSQMHASLSIIPLCTHTNTLACKQSDKYI